MPDIRFSRLIYLGEPITCTAEEYPDVRRALQNLAGLMIDENQSVRAIIALNEVRRLDELFNYKIGESHARHE